MTLEKLMTTQEVADYLGVPIATIYAWSARGKGPVASKIGRHLRFRESDVAAFVEKGMAA